MSQLELTFGGPGESARAVGSEAPPRPPTRDREALLAFLDGVTQRIREAEALGGPQASGDAEARRRLGNTVRNALMIAGRARRAVEALPGTDLELLRAHGRLLAAARDAQEARTAAELVDGARIRLAPRAKAAPRVAPAERRSGVAR